jgi:hypothetical protein
MFDPLAWMRWRRNRLGETEAAGLAPPVMVVVTAVMVPMMVPVVMIAPAPGAVTVIAARERQRACQHPRGDRDSTDPHADTPLP